MDIIQRRHKILKKVVEEYIKTALPVSSELLQSEWFFDVSPATIRLDLAELTNGGFLEKPYISGGRVPTDRGYRFFVDHLPQTDHQTVQTRKFSEFLAEFHDIAKLSQEIARILAKHSANLGIVYLKDFDILWQEGWPKLIREPEFNDISCLRDFTNSLQELINQITNLLPQSQEKANVFIGQECPLKKNNFSVIIGQGFWGNQKEQQIFFGVTGPRRMDFSSNIRLINNLMRAFNSYD
ncbi:MAG: hypothetical protein PHN39_03610 [Candidatus Pacebacteria bacterium]|nr:hypothetical protein [Candidatus Paceibacterota bacterium]